MLSQLGILFDLLHGLQNQEREIQIPMRVQTRPVLLKRLPVLFLPQFLKIVIIHHLRNAFQKQRRIINRAEHFQCCHSTFRSIAPNKQVIFHGFQNFEILKIGTILAQNKAAKTMDRTNVHSIRHRHITARLFQRSIDAPFQRLRSLLCKCKCHNLFRQDAFIRLHDVHNASGKHFRLPGTGARYQLQMMLYLMHGFILRISQMNFTHRIQPAFCKSWHCTSLCRGHPALPRCQNARADTLDCCLPYQTRGKYLPQRPANRRMHC